MATRKNRTSRKNRKDRKNRNSRKNEPMMGGAKKVPAVGSKAAVWHGSAKHTSGGLTRKDLMKTKRGRIVSRKKHAAGQKAIKNLRKAGYVAKKGQFKLFTKKSKRGGFSDAMAGSMSEIAKMMAAK
jgi:DVNP family